ncbi:hypothetical protein JCM11251_007570 [Rhodosporidiobolus azoricus]
MNIDMDMGRSESGASMEFPSSPPSTNSGRSRPTTSSGSGSGIAPMSPALSVWSPSGMRRRNGRIFRSTRIDPAAYKDRTPWHETPAGKSTLRRTRWTCLGVSMIGVLGAAALVVTGYLSIPKHEYCLVLDEQFNGNSLDMAIWTHEVQVGGFGNKEFEMTTTSTDNAFVEDGNLYIVPTLSNETYGNDAIINGYTLNLTADGTCTGTTDAQCVAFSNSTAGNYSVIPPIRSARLTTKLSRSIKYGKVEVKARMPTGDWIWPAIWMMPKDEMYGAWPASGEIDIVETKGNIPKHEWDTDVNVAQSTLHWGLDHTTDRYKWTTGWKKLKRHYLNSAYYTYGMYWDSKGIRSWISKPSRATYSLKFDQPFWNRGDLASTNPNSSVPINPWTQSENQNAAPFDQEFYLILSVAVGGTNGFFEDTADKPWSNQSPYAARDFWLSASRWLPTWPSDPKQRGMAVESVKIWRLKEAGETCQA